MSDSTPRLTSETDKEDFYAIIDRLRRDLNKKKEPLSKTIEKSTADLRKYIKTYHAEKFYREAVNLNWGFLKNTYEAKKIPKLKPVLEILERYFTEKELQKFSVRLFCLRDIVDRREEEISLREQIEVAKDSDAPPQKIEALEQKLRDSIENQEAKRNGIKWVLEEIDQERPHIIERIEEEFCSEIDAEFPFDKDAEDPYERIEGGYQMPEPKGGVMPMFPPDYKLSPEERRKGKLLDRMVLKAWDIDRQRRFEERLRKSIEKFGGSEVDRAALKKYRRNRERLEKEFKALKNAYEQKYEFFEWFYTEYKAKRERQKIKILGELQERLEKKWEEVEEKAGARAQLKVFARLDLAKSERNRLIEKWSAYCDREIELQKKFDETIAEEAQEFAANWEKFLDTKDPAAREKAGASLARIKETLKRELGLKFGEVIELFPYYIMGYCTKGYTVEKAYAVDFNPHKFIYSLHREQGEQKTRRGEKKGEKEPPPKPHPRKLQLGDEIIEETKEALFAEFDRVLEDKVIAMVVKSHKHRETKDSKDKEKIIKLADECKKIIKEDLGYNYEEVKPYYLSYYKKKEKKYLP